MSETSPAPDLSQPIDDWLNWLETIHPAQIDMGLERVAAVADRLELRPATRPLILVAGTNGKGSTVAMLNSIYSRAGYRVGCYTSPHIEHFCERIKIGPTMASEQSVVEALSFVESGRAPDLLTYFEYTTLAAMRVFQTNQCDVLLFEVGLGGRLDATNIWDADCSIVTSIALDHEAYLGSDVSVIATEKAAIGRTDRPLIVGDRHPPDSIFEYAQQQNMHLHHVGALPVQQLPKPGLPGVHQQRNAACAVAAVDYLKHQLPVSEADVNSALNEVQLSARFEQRQHKGARLVMDVAHNPAGALALLEAWRQQFGHQRCEMIFASLNDKDIEGIVEQLLPCVAQWHCLELDVPRAAPLDELKGVVKSLASGSQVFTHNTANAALAAATEYALSHNRPILIAGSFHTIAAIRAQIDCTI